MKQKQIFEQKPSKNHANTKTKVQIKGKINNKILRFRPLCLQDLPHIMDWINNPKVRGKFANFTGKVTVDEERRFLTKLIQSKTDKTFSIFIKNSNQYIGQVALNNISNLRKNARVSINISEESQCNGFGSQSIRKIISYAFKELNLHKVHLTCLEENFRARKLYHELGFREEGILREEYPIFGVFKNMVQMSILRSEY